MARSRRSQRGLAGLAAVGIAVSGCSAMPPPESEEQPVGAGGGASASAELAQDFLDEWVDDGRVVRRDQGDDTVSEGQAYGLMAAVVADDEESFDRIWDWTVDELMRDDGLLAWRWEAGAVADDEPASDAELDAARALILAADRFDRDDLEQDGVELAGDVLDHLTAETAIGRVMLPGLWAAGLDAVPYNPSYASPAAFDLLGERTGDDRWAELAEGSDRATSALLSSAALPPDWAQIQPDGTVVPMPGARGEGPAVQYGYDAQRVVIRYAESCDEERRALVSGIVPALSYADQPPAQSDLGGGALTDDRSPLSLVARAAASGADGDADAARADLDRATALSRETATYYGHAWVALGTAMLAGELGGCATLEDSA